MSIIKNSMVFETDSGWRPTAILAKQVFYQLAWLNQRKYGRLFNEFPSGPTSFEYTGHQSKLYYV